MQYSIRFGISRRILYVNVPGLFASALPAVGAIRDSMARKANSKKPPAPKSGFRPTLERLKPSRRVQAPEAAPDAQQGMLQLTFARHAHGYGFLAAFAFIFNVILLVFFASQPLPITGLRLDYILWLLPAVAGALSSWDAVRLKREPYRRHYVSRHFASSCVGMALFFVVAVAIILAMQGALPTWLIPWIYPLSAAGVSLTIVSMGMTWQGLGGRKLGSVGLALFLPVLMIFLTLPDPGLSITTVYGRTLYTFTFLVGALTTEISGSLLHIIASSTSIYQREILKADNSKVAIIQQDYQKKREALDYKERALRGREAHLEALQQELEDQAKDLKTKLGEVTTREVSIEKGTSQLRDLDRKVASARAEIEAKAEEIRLRDSYLATLKTELEKTRQSVGTREASLAEREKVVKRASIELTSKVRGSETKLKSIEERESRLQEHEKSFDSTRTSLLKKEKELQLKDSEIRMKSERLEGTTSSAEATRIRELKDWESKILAKEKEVGKQEVELRTLESQLRERYENATRIDKQFQGQRRMYEDRETEFVTREKAIEERESDVQLKALELETKTREGRAGGSTPGMRDLDRESQLEAWEQRLREREEEFKRRAYQKEKEMEMREGAVKARITTAAGAVEAEEAVAIEKKAARVKTGTPRLDDLLYGGIPFNSNVLFVGPAFVGKEVALLNFIAEGLKKGIPVIIITTTKLPIDVAKDIAPILPTFVEYDQLGLVRWIDCTSPMASGKPVKEKNVWRVNGPTDFDNIYQVVNQLDEEFKKKYPYFRLAYLTLSSSITQADERDAMNFFQRLVNRLRQTKAVSAIALERGMHNDQTLEAMEHMVDGAIHFKSDKQKTQLQVVGLGEVQTHDWVPYKFTNKAIMIGSFQLERIR